jgi:hypothetical protein
MTNRISIPKLSFVCFVVKKTKQSQIPILVFLCSWHFVQTNRAPSEAGAIQQVSILPGQRIASRPEYDYTYKEVTNYARL